MYKVTQSEGFVNLSLNENYLSFCQEKAISLQNLNRYPDTSLYQEIAEEAAKLYGVDANQVLLTNGSDDGIFLLQQWFAYNAGSGSCCSSACKNNYSKKGFFATLFSHNNCSTSHLRRYPPSIIITDPTFSMYENYAQNLGLGVIKQSLDSNLQVDINALITCIYQNPKSLVFLPNPNSPTGTFLQTTELERILQTGAKIVIDEAYIEFSMAQSAIGLLEKYANLIVLRTLSKFYGLAAVRIGFVIGRIANEVRAFQAPFSVSSVNAEIALNTLRYVNKSMEKVIDFAKDFVQSRMDFVSKLQTKENVRKIYETEANFVLFEVSNIADVLEKFQNQKFLVKNFSATLPNTIRVTLASKEINAKMLECI